MVASVARQSRQIGRRDDKAYKTARVDTTPSPSVYSYATPLVSLIIFWVGCPSGQPDGPVWKSSFFSFSWVTRCSLSPSIITYPSPPAVALIISAICCLIVFLSGSTIQIIQHHWHDLLNGHDLNMDEETIIAHEIAIYDL